MHLRWLLGLHPHRFTPYRQRIERQLARDVIDTSAIYADLVLDVTDTDCFWPHRRRLFLKSQTTTAFEVTDTDFSWCHRHRLFSKPQTHTVLEVIGTDCLKLQIQTVFNVTQTVLDVTDTNSSRSHRHNYTVLEITETDCYGSHRNRLLWKSQRQTVLEVTKDCYRSHREGLLSKSQRRTVIEVTDTDCQTQNGNACFGDLKM